MSEEVSIKISSFPEEAPCTKISAEGCSEISNTLLMLELGQAKPEAVVLGVVVLRFRSSHIRDKDMVHGLEVVSWVKHQSLEATAIRKLVSRIFPDTFRSPYAYTIWHWKLTTHQNM